MLLCWEQLLLNLSNCRCLLQSDPRDVRTRIKRSGPGEQVAVSHVLCVVIAAVIFSGVPAQGRKSGRLFIERCGGSVLYHIFHPTTIQHPTLGNSVSFNDVSYGRRHVCGLGFEPAPLVLRSMTCEVSMDQCFQLFELLHDHWKPWRYVDYLELNARAARTSR